MRVVETSNYKKAYMDYNTMPGNLESPGEISKDILPLLVVDKHDEKGKKNKKNRTMKHTLPADGGNRVNDEPEEDSIPQNML